ncbi:hypothetical protein PI124_g3590 [Phytophthora idaei]|nr:hypothetical protein PI124_g3590 [Phytophthora idaei]
MGKRKRKHIKQLTWSQLWSKLKKLGNRRSLATSSHRSTLRRGSSQAASSCSCCNVGGVAGCCVSHPVSAQPAVQPPAKSRQTPQKKAYKIGYCAFSDWSAYPAASPIMKAPANLPDEDEFFVDDEEESDVEAASEGSAREEESATDE